ncbi:phage gp6-like head-tail connector family protein [Brucella grignonensis]|uniref:Phage gp6-like head-tail connector family protein n=1 Tax=Brucella grignonensis TaxID=94627 RepID=A0A256F796_9HYPH|nr:phage gp6-like head-tail connector family protein [Brucella grignonensis]
MNLLGAEIDAEFLQHKIDAAESFIQAYIGRKFSDIPEVGADLKEAVLQLAAHLYEHREAVLIGVNANELPYGVGEMIRHYRLEWFGEDHGE